MPVNELNRRKGYTFIKFTTFEQAIAAINNLNGVEILGRALKVQHRKQ
jgi:RNA recognition motif-containing protein